MAKNDKPIEIESDDLNADWPKYVDGGRHKAMEQRIYLEMQIEYAGDNKERVAELQTELDLLKEEHPEVFKDDPDEYFDEGEDDEEDE